MDDETFHGDYEECFGPPKEEPDCPPCMDSGWIPIIDGHRRSGSYNCESCNPTRQQLERERDAEPSSMRGSGTWPFPEPLF